MTTAHRRGNLCAAVKEGGLYEKSGSQLLFAERLPPRPPLNPSGGVMPFGGVIPSGIVNLPFSSVGSSLPFGGVIPSGMVNSPFSKLTGLNFLVFFVYGGQMNLMFLNYVDMQEILALTGNEGGEIK